MRVDDSAELRRRHEAGNELSRDHRRHGQDQRGHRRRRQLVLAEVESRYLVGREIERAQPMSEHDLHVAGTPESARPARRKRGPARRER